MNTRETLVLSTLQMKAIHTGSGNSSLLDAVLADNPQAADELTKNVCARIPLDLAHEMEQLGGLLNINKREMITLAIRDFLDQAEGVMREFDAWKCIEKEA